MSDTSPRTQGKKRKKFVPAPEGSKRTTKPNNTYIDSSEDEEDVPPTKEKKTNTPTSTPHVAKDPINQEPSHFASSDEENDSGEDISVEEVPDELVQEVGDPVKLKGVARFPILQHWNVKGDKTDSDTAVHVQYQGTYTYRCKYCDSERKCDISKSTGNLWSHSATHGHKSSSASAKEKKIGNSLGFEVIGKKLNPKIVDTANYHLMKVLVGDMRPLSFGFSDNFKNFTNVLSPLYEVPQQDGTNTLLTSYLKGTAQPAVKKELKPIAKMAGTSDGWKSATKIAMQTLEVHYVDSNGNPKHRVLDVSEIDAESIDNVVLQKYFREVFAKYGIPLEKITLFVVDGGSNQWKALEELGIPIVWCGCHAIAIAIKTGFNSMPEFLAAYMKPKTLVSWFNTSMTHMKSLRDQ